MKYKDHRAFGLYMFFKLLLVIADPDLIRTVLTKNFGSFHDRGLYFNEKINLLYDNLFFINGKRWRNIRTKMTPAFTSLKIKQIFPIVKECSEGLAKYLDNKAQMRDSIEIKDIFARYTTDIIMSTAFGIRSNCIEEPNNEYRIQGKNILKIKIIRFILSMSIPKIMDIFSIPLTDRRITSFYTNIFRDNVEYKQVHKIIKHDFKNLLIQIMEKDYVDDDKKTTDVTSTINKLTMAEATAQNFIFFLAGFETSTATATFALYELAHHQDKVHKEIDETLTKHDLTYDAMNEMPYLTKTLRKYPPLPMLNHISQFGHVQTKVGHVSLLSKYKFKPHSQTAVPFIFNEKSFGFAVKGVQIQQESLRLDTLDNPILKPLACGSNAHNLSLTHGLRLSSSELSVTDSGGKMVLMIVPQCRGLRRKLQEVDFVVRCIRFSVLRHLIRSCASYGLD
ncbi:putative cytochrome P450 6a20 [Temnothorax longispinosus]|uniref:Putative cytochrome P450 6a20 n=1 Tax=Temnothorax longispinosus TaxID=300112 RepID=A0A4S2L9P8_9HYME|nr:putative cytochrome P450 6a20 [Temnothorax longispinosus]